MAFPLAVKVELEGEHPVMPIVAEVAPAGKVVIVIVSLIAELAWIIASQMKAQFAEPARVMAQLVPDWVLDTTS